ncbi:MAG: 2-C-methyl-D-erythritol 4-phosphate cytidylyltransferase [Tepidiformaceae bacterium]
MKVDVVIVAAGTATRFGAEKLFLDLCGRPVLAWSLAACESAETVGRIVIVAPAQRLALVQALADKWCGRKLVAVVGGGARRRDSVEAGLRECSSPYVGIHDGARPLVTAGLIDAVARAAEGKPGAIAAVPLSDSVKSVRDGIVTGHPDRSRLWAAQTPQVVLRQAWLDAAATDDEDETDDAAMLSRLGLECAVVEGDSANIKLTRAIDLEVARALLAARSRA